MREANETPEITPIVRQYSLTVERTAPDDPLSQALGLVVKKQDNDETTFKLQALEWNKWLQFGESQGPLEKQRKELVETWDTFQHLFHGDGESVRPPNSIPTIETLRVAINQAQGAWLAKKTKGFGKAKDRFFDFLDTMNDHSYLFKVIPSGDKYISLITGVVSSVVTASTNYKKIAEGFSMALVDISSDLHFVTKSVEIADSQEMRRLVVELYVGVFKLLCHTMDWFKRKKNRFLSALNKNFYDDTVQGLVHGIRKTVQRVRDESQYIANGRVERIEGMVSHALALRTVGSESRNDNIETTQRKLAHAKESLGYSSVRTLVSVEKRLVQGRLPNAHILEANPDWSPERTGNISVKYDVDSVSFEDISSKETNSVNEDDGDYSVSEDGSNGPCSRYEIERLSRLISVYLEDGREDVSRAAPSSNLPDEVLIQMQRWIQAPESKMLWVGGDPVSPYGSGLSHAAMRLSTVSMEAGLPCVSFFCKPRYNFTNTSHVSGREAGLIALLYSVITQLTYLLPTEFTATKDLDEAQFHLLDGSMDSVPVALQIIQALLTHAPSSLIWVLDGLQLAENQATIPHLKAFIDILRDEEIKRVSKVCFTTDGNSYVLMTNMHVSERVDASRMSQRPFGHVLIGVRDINELGGNGWRGI
ncbi:hypothetical protein G7Z17_g2378 [Cylindrodendrum hubeiense]|uniref:Fungal STAND N-terminal Goodbye domain-containing protein n=1 Tax=Cylindrodendrum hubeiense TaxID=595255 RepID=A0A9P5HKY8_9HYPO|nr:hypothetical protein G7Z17_g2378 [Cylindrodendrum hubeiense]